MKCFMYFPKQCAALCRVIGSALCLRILSPLAVQGINYYVVLLRIIKISIDFAPFLVLAGGNFSSDISV